MTWISTISALARSSLPALTPVDDAVRVMADRYGRLVGAAYTFATQSNRSEEINPLDQRYVPSILADAASVAQLTTVDFYLDMAAFRFGSIQWSPADEHFTLKVYATDEDNGTAPELCDYQDVTALWFTAPSFGSDAFLFLHPHTFVKYIHIEVERAGSVGTEAHTLYARRGW